MRSFHRLSSSTAFTRDRLPPRLAAIACFALTSAAVTAIAHGDVRRALRSFDVAAPRAAAPAAGDTPAPSLHDARDELPSLALFGVDEDPAVRTATPAETPAPVTESLPAAATPLRLFGVIAAAAPGDARAFVGSDDATQLTLRPGERLPDGATLLEVSARGVILERAGRREWLALPVDTATSGAAPAVRPRFMARPVARVPAPAS